MQHLFLNVIKEIEAIFNRSGLTANIEIKVRTIWGWRFTPHF